MNQNILEDIFVKSFAEYGDAIFRFCMVKISNTELAEDMTQEVFTRYWQYLREGREMTNTRAFLYTIAHNMAKDWYKKKKSVSLDRQIESGNVPVSQSLNSETQAAYQEVLAVIHGMEQIDRDVLLLKYVDGLDPRDIAEILDETANTISVRLNRAMKRLQQEMHI